MNDRVPNSASATTAFTVTCGCCRRNSPTSSSTCSALPGCAGPGAGTAGRPAFLTPARPRRLSSFCHSTCFGSGRWNRKPTGTVSLGVTSTRNTRVCPLKWPPVFLSKTLCAFQMRLVRLQRRWSLSSATSTPSEIPCRRNTSETPARNNPSQGTFERRNIHDNAPSRYSPSPARPKAAQQTVLVSRTPVRQNFSQARCARFNFLPGECALTASSSAST
jgi:hypothetical protein